MNQNLIRSVNQKDDMEKLKNGNFIMITMEEMNKIPHSYPQFNRRCIISKELETHTISETPSSLLFLMVLQFCKN